ncbi:MAG TPA: hypothetical protein VFI24_27980 [Pyrinomonadaceae bacterium]|nr:hypothetical protein [Pyrinomonadaceae bacterium]
MKELTCEDVLMAHMVEVDGERSEFSTEQLSVHIAGCANCQHELEQLQALDQLLTAQSLSDRQVDLWPAIKTRIGKQSSAAFHWRPFALIGLLLVVYKLLEMLPARDLGMAFKLVPLVIVVLLFVFIKENPFRINTELVLER